MSIAANRNTPKFSLNFKYHGRLYSHSSEGNGRVWNIYWLFSQLRSIYVEKIKCRVTYLDAAIAGNHSIPRRPRPQVLRARGPLALWLMFLFDLLLLLYSLGSQDFWRWRYNKYYFLCFPGHLWFGDEFHLSQNGKYRTFPTFETPEQKQEAHRHDERGDRAHSPQRRVWGEPGAAFRSFQPPAALSKYDTGLFERKRRLVSFAGS